MRAIANEQLEGFPKRDELKSVFVEHEIEDEEARELGVRNAERNYSLSFNPPIYIYIYTFWGVSTWVKWGIRPLREGFSPMKLSWG